MNICFKSFCLSAIFLCVLSTCDSINAKKLFLGIILDQCSYQSLYSQKDNLSGGIRWLWDNGSVYAQATMPNGLTKTAPGHALISTGCYARDHGVIDNAWYDRTLDTMVEACVDQTVYTVDETGIGKKNSFSAQSLMVDTLADNFILNSTAEKACSVYAFSPKNRSACLLAGRMGKAFWLDESTSKVTSSTAYVQNFPIWVKEVIKNYGSYGKRIYAKNNKKIYPEIRADRLTEELAQACLLHESVSKTDVLGLWVSFYGLDYVGHRYGPQSKRWHHSLINLDACVDRLIKKAHELFGQENITIVLTSDHGVLPIPEHLYQKGFKLAHRILSSNIKNGLNSHINRLFTIKNAVLRVTESSVYLHKNILNSNLKIQILSEVKKWLKNLVGIRDAWDFNELKNMVFEPDDVRNLLKNQLYESRSGDIIFLTHPYAHIADYPLGTSHSTPYAYDTHVPLILYNKSLYEKKIITTPVTLRQLAPTIAQFFGCSRPSVATDVILPV